jgi:hypothetical protein
MQRYWLALSVAIIGLLFGCSTDPTSTHQGAKGPRAEAAQEGDLRDTPRCDAGNAVVDEDLAGRWVFEYVLTNPGAGPGCFPWEAFVDTVDLCVGDTFFIDGSSYVECTMIGDWSDLVFRASYFYQIADDCELNGTLVEKLVFSGDSHYGSLTTSQTLTGTGCEPYDEDFECIGRVLTLSGHRIGPPTCTEPKSVALHRQATEIMIEQTRDRRERVRPRDVKDVRQYR